MKNATVIILKFLIISAGFFPGRIFGGECGCFDAIKKIFVNAPNDSINACSHLAFAILDSISGTPKSVQIDSVPLSLVQPAQSRFTGTQGAIGQISAVPTVEPVAMAGGSMAFAGTGDGEIATAAISLNPSFFATGSTESYAKMSRFSDLTVLVPVNLSSGKNEQTIKMIGVNARVNLLGPSEGVSVLENQKNKIKEIFDQALSADYNDDKKIEQLLKGSSDVCECAKALLEKNDENIKTKCGASFKVSSDSIYNELKSATSKIQQLADSRYFGLDLRYHRTLTSDSNQVSYLFCGLAGGKKLIAQKLTNITLNFRLGLAYRDSATIKPLFAADGGFGFALKRPFGSEQVELAAAFEGRKGIKTSDQVSVADEYWFRASLTVPLIQGNGISVNVGFPMFKNGQPIINVGYNWSLKFDDNQEKLRELLERYIN